MKYTVEWADLKTLAFNKGLDIFSQPVPSGEARYAFVFDGGVLFEAYLTESADITELETTYANIGRPIPSRVSIAPFEPPAGRTTVAQIYEETTNKNQTENDDWVIPTGETVTITSFSFGAYLNKDTDDPINARARLLYRPNGNSTGQVTIDAIYLNGVSDVAHSLNWTSPAAGDGTAELRAQVHNRSKETISASRIFRGYY